MIFKPLLILLLMASCASAREPWMRHTIDNSSQGADGVRLEDVNTDGLPDLVTPWEEGGLVRVYIHPGAAKVNRPWPHVTVGHVASPEDAVFVDIRDAKDFSAGHIANAVNIPFATLTSRMSELDKYKDKPLILVCKSGQTVNMAGKTLREKGFNAVRMSGGMMEWNNQNLPVVRS